MTSTSPRPTKAKQRDIDLEAAKDCVSLSVFDADPDDQQASGVEATGYEFCVQCDKFTGSGPTLNAALRAWYENKLRIPHQRELPSPYLKHKDRLCSYKWVSKQFRKNRVHLLEQMSGKEEDSIWRATTSEGVGHGDSPEAAVECALGAKYSKEYLT